MQSYFGANVLHPRTIIPVMRYDIPIVIRNIFNLSAPGTTICRSASEDVDGQNLDSPVKGFATIDNLALVNVEGYVFSHDFLHIFGYVLLYFFIFIIFMPHLWFSFGRTGMAGVPGTASAIFSAVKDVGANVIMISQVPTLHSLIPAILDMHGMLISWYWCRLVVSIRSALLCLRRR